MMGDLFSYVAPPEREKAFSRRSDPETSREAADSVESSLSALEKVVFDRIEASGDRGLTVDALVELTELDKVTISPRLKPLEAKSKIRRDGKRPGASNRAQTVWKAVRSA